MAGGGPMDPLEIVAKVTGEQEIARLTKEIEKSSASIEKLNAELKGGAINQAQFDAAATRAAGNIAKSTQRIEELKGSLGGVSAGSSNAARGLLQIGYAVDDLQYGFRAIVNNIPMIVQGLGGGAGVAGAVAILAVAASQLINHWDELSGKLEDTAPWQVAIGAVEQLKEAWKGLDAQQRDTLKGLAAASGGPAGLALEWLFGGDASAKGKLNAANAKRKEGNAKFEEGGFGGIEGKREQMKGKAFKEAVEEYGGSEKLFKDTFKAQLKATPGTDQDLLKARIREQIEAGLKGKDQIGGTFFGDKFGGLEEKARIKAQADKEAKATDKQVAAEDADRKAEADELNRAGKENEDKLKFQLQDEGKRLAEQKKDLQEQIADEKKNRSTIVSGTKAFVDKMQVDALNAIPKEQLQELKELNDKMKKNNNALEALARAGARAQ